jgi:hypothetical protein
MRDIEARQPLRMHALSKVFERFQTILRQLFGEKSAAKEAPKELFDMVLCVLLNPPWRDRPLVSYSL